MNVGLEVSIDSDEDRSCTRDDSGMYISHITFLLCSNKQKVKSNDKHVCDIFICKILKKKTHR